MSTTVAGNVPVDGQREHGGPAPDTAAATPAARSVVHQLGRSPATRVRGSAGAAGPRWRRAAVPGRSSTACTASAAGRPRSAASACGTCSGSSPRVVAVADSSAGTNTTGRRSTGAVRGARRGNRLSSRQAMHQAAEQAGRRVVGVALEPAGQLQRLIVDCLPGQRVPGGDPGDHRGRRRAEPASVRDRVVSSRSYQAGQGSRVASQVGPQSRAPPGGSRRSARVDPAPCAVDPHHQPGVGQPHLDDVVEREREAERVEAGPEVGGGSRDGDLEPAARSRAGPAPCATAAGSTASGSTSTLPASAVLRVLQAVPGDGADDQRARAAAGRRPAVASRPATLAADAGLDEHALRARPAAGRRAGSARR